MEDVEDESENFFKVEDVEDETILLLYIIFKFPICEG